MVRDRKGKSIQFWSLLLCFNHPKWHKWLKCTDPVLLLTSWSATDDPHIDVKFILVSSHTPCEAIQGKLPACRTEWLAVSRKSFGPLPSKLYHCILDGKLGGDQWSWSLFWQRRQRMSLCCMSMKALHMFLQSSLSWTLKPDLLLFYNFYIKTWDACYNWWYTIV